VDAHFSESHDSGRVKEVNDFFGISLGEPLAQRCCGVRKPAHLQQLPPSTSLKDVQCPGLMLTLCSEDALLRDLEGFIEAVQDGEDIAQPLRRQKTPPLHDSYVLGGQTRIQRTYLSIPAGLANKIECNRKGISRIVQAGFG
jgi:hypothetical protein